jgi:hypothetical protein
MTSVSYRIFEEFVKNNNLAKIRGKWFHSFDYMDNKGFIRATEESSSWGGGDSYLIDSEEAENLNTLEFVNNIIKNKQK